jgi:hypothetical protein
LLAASIQGFVYKKDFVQENDISESAFAKLWRDFNAQLEYSDLEPWHLYSVEPFGESGDCYSPGFYGKQVGAFVKGKLESTEL